MLKGHSLTIAICGDHNLTESAIRVRALCPDPKHRKQTHATVMDQGYYGINIVFDCGARYVGEGEYLTHAGPRGGCKRLIVPNKVWRAWRWSNWIDRLTKQREES